MRNAFYVGLYRSVRTATPSLYGTVNVRANIQSALILRPDFSLTSLGTPGNESLTSSFQCEVEAERDYVTGLNVVNTGARAAICLMPHRLLIWVAGGQAG